MPSPVTSDRVTAFDPTRPVVNYPGGSDPVARALVTGGALAVSYGTLLLAQTPLLYWPLADVSVGIGNVSNLGSLGGYNGGIQSVGVTVRVAGPQAGGFAMRFAGGAASFLDIEGGAGGIALPTTSQTGTLIFWFKGNGGAAGTPFAIARNGGLTQIIHVCGAAGVTQLNIRRDTGATNAMTLTTAASLPDGVWHMIAVSSSNSGSDLIYIDGVAVSTTPATFGTGTAADWFGDMDAVSTDYWTTIGARRIVLNSGSIGFVGDIAQVSLHNSILTPATIAALWAATAP